MVCGPFPSPCSLCGQAAGKNAPSRLENVAGQEVGGSHPGATFCFSIGQYLPRVCPEEVWGWMALCVDHMKLPVYSRNTGDGHAEQRCCQGWKDL